MRTLRVTSGPGAGTTVEIERELVIGREACDIELADAEASRRHAAVRPVEGGIEVEDLGSMNGTHVNGRRIDGPVLLDSGSTMRIGKSHMAFEVATSSAPEQAPPLAPDVTVARDVVTDPDATVARDVVADPDATVTRDVVAGPDVTAPREVTDPDVTAPRDVPAPDVTAPRDVPAPDVTAPRDVPAPDVTAPRDVVHEPDVTAPRETVSAPPDVTVERGIPENVSAAPAQERGKPPALLFAGIAIAVAVVILVILLLL